MHEHLASSPGLCRSLVLSDFCFGRVTSVFNLRVRPVNLAALRASLRLHSQSEAQLKQQLQAFSKNGAAGVIGSLLH